MQEDRRAGPHQGARLPWASRSTWTSSPRSPTPARYRHQGHRRPLRSGLQGHAAFLGVRHLQRAREGRARSASSPSASSTTSRNLSLPEDPELPEHRSPRHHRVQVLGSGRRRHRRREQELHQDHRRPHRQVRAGLLPVRLQEDRRRDHQPPALRRLSPSAAPTTSTRPTSWPATTRPTSPRTSRSSATSSPAARFMINCQWDFDELEHHLIAAAKRYIAQERHPALHHQRHRPGQSRSAWASAPTPSCSPPSSLWPRSCPQEEAIQLHEGRRRRTPT